MHGETVKCMDIIKLAAAAVVYVIGKDKICNLQRM